VNHPITHYLPHRPPFLFVDELVSLEGQTAVVRLHVRPEFDFFRGHYPSNPIMPGVIISEAVFQAGSVLLRKLEEAGVDTAPPGTVPVLTRIQDARFRSVVRPGDVLTIEVTLKERTSRFFFMHGAVRVDERRVMSVDFSVALADAAQVAPPSAAPSP
jgi:3-hydroxyacyl-[acyl-carrier-protein] dehydratase